ncbi:DNA-3-methyladenine glycosylase I [Shinella yambaruensis]|uniref:DNA-3-methyladenine glycosylase I n=1 Tax=Shinella yambaruensis TaxID=415996 RepID=UPI001FD4C8BE|nr:DNA-3-methyladenine glycosylase I [Shinella yambaruensis]MCJ8028381.1 DNA-3-methyladenine glycosylase I [Shinella yambaruensis]MCU7981434.1 DNA-3-methyladenine glycosylase I [Shinella yambaruensis]
MKLRSFEEIYALAAARKGGVVALENILALTPSLPAGDIARISDDRVLAAMTRQIFGAGFSYKVIERKWPAFEAGFDGFDPHACAFMSEERFDALLRDPSIVRSARKILAVQRNAQFVLELSSEHGRAARFFAEWPDERYIDLVHVVRRRGAYLGGETAMRFLRALGKPAFVTSPDMVAALVREGVLSRPSIAKRDLQVVQEAMNQWAASSGRDFTTISRVLSMSVGLPPASAERPWEAWGL